MFRAIGIVIVLWALSGFFQSSFQALDSAATAVFNTIEVAARSAEFEFTAQ
jgi:hypothetical protein